MNTGPAVAKTVWTNADFDAMTRHDNAVHAVAVEPVPDNPGRLLLDIGYILEGVLPEPPATTLNFWICPATLVFDPAWDLATDINMRGGASSCTSTRSSGPGPTSTATSSGPSPATTAVGDDLYPGTGCPRRARPAGLRPEFRLSGHPQRSPGD